MRGESAAGMPMPEASVNEHGGAVARQDQIGAAGQTPVMEPEPQAETVESRPEDPLRAGVAPANGGHHPRSGGRIDDIHRQVP